MTYLTAETRELEDLRRKYAVAANLVAEQTQEITRLRAELDRAVRDINRLGNHDATYDNCHVCTVVRSYGYDPEAIRE